MIDHILLVGFGAPEKPEDIPRFLQRIARGRAIPESRLKEVLHHYQLIGGYSPYNRHTFYLLEQIRNRLIQDSCSLPVFVGMRNWHPFLEETVSGIKNEGLNHGLAFLLAPHRSEVSCQRYRENVQDALIKNHAEAIHYKYAPSWYDMPQFIEAQVKVVRKKWEVLTSSARQETEILFCAHSIPVSMSKSCSGCSYQEEYQKTCELIANRMNWVKWRKVYQSRSGTPHEPWLEPDILEAVYEAKQKGKKSVFVIPVGFWCDNVEVLYDLDVEAKNLAIKSGMDFYRAETVLKEPEFHDLFLQIVRDLLMEQSQS